ncbi:MAG: S8 family serine peptidase [Bacteroidales bacterium]|nr:S8 family serine peptidase [Bacteroidales bacterium]MDD4670305.1 S8 family serine peptidase [Bacteroidales bacterium]
MKKRYFILCLAFITMLLGCNKEIETPNTNSDIPLILNNLSVYKAAPGHIRVKMEEEIVNTQSLSNTLSDLNIISVERTFPYCGKFEKRTREEGLHLWYDIAFDQSVAVTKAASDILKIKGVKYIEYMVPASPKQTVTYPFNDPRLPDQWHYNNSGQKDGFLPGADINLFKAWEIASGSEDIIVAIVDNGVQYEHEDLKDNMWVNEAELNGRDGVDDDNNGYIDDVYGYNFTVTTDNVTMNGQISPGDHGSHVAGTVGAVNNNGKGGCGIAGGDGVHKGVRLMCCQMMPGAAYPQRAIKYAADNGAIIAQNSWGADDGQLASSVREAIDYFNKYAGVDESGKQAGPMKGGIVIFAAGNENTDKCYPAMYEGTMAVAALGASNIKASYSNFGEWVDISAPGGDSNPYGLVISCLAEKDKYGGMGGTSQACPHVSGIAALAVEHFGGPGFTRDMLWNLLINGTRNIDEYNPGYIGKLGAGLIDAHAVLYSEGQIPPLPVDNINISVKSNFITLDWIVPTDEDSNKASWFDIYYSKSSLSKLDLTQELPEGVTKVKIGAGTRHAGEKIETTISELEFMREYYFRIDAYDNSNNHAGLSKQVSASTKTNTIPVITPLDGTDIVLKAHESKEMAFRLFDADGHPLSISLETEPDAKGIRAKKSNDTTAVISINGKSIAAGKYSAKLILSDSYDEVSVNMTYEVLPNHAPRMIKQFDNLYIDSKGKIVDFNMNDYFVDDDGEVLTFTAQSLATTTVVKTAFSNNILNVTGNWYGTASISVIATDGLNASCSATLDVLVRDGSQEIDLYPNPVSDRLNIRMAESENAKVTIYSTYGSKVIEQDISISLFVPAVIDVKSLQSGNYVVVIDLGDRQIKRNIVKL